MGENEQIEEKVEERKEYSFQIVYDFEMNTFKEEKLDDE